MKKSTKETKTTKTTKTAAKKTAKKVVQPKATKPAAKKTAAKKASKKAAPTKATKSKAAAANGSSRKIHGKKLDLKWSKLLDDGCGNKYMALHNWRSAKHPKHHKAEIWMKTKGKKTTYEACVVGGRKGDSVYLAQSFTDLEEAQKAVLREIRKAVGRGAMQL